MKKSFTILLCIFILFALCVPMALGEASTKDDLIPLDGTNGLMLCMEKTWMHICDEDGKDLYGLHLYSAPEFINGYAIVNGFNTDYEQKVGLVDVDGGIIIPFEYSYISRSEDSDLLVACKNNKYGYLSYTGEVVVDFQFEIARAFIGDYAVVGMYDSSTEQMSSEALLLGIINRDAEFTVPCQYSEISDMDGETAWVKDGEFWNKIDMHDNILLETRYRLKNGSFVGDYCVVGDRWESDKPANYSDQWEFAFGIIDRDGNEILPMIYDTINEIRPDNTVEAKLNKKWDAYLLTPNGAEKVSQVKSELSLDEYKPFVGAKVAVLGEEPTLDKRTSATHRHPNLDGATALFPVYAAVVQAVYPDVTRYGDESSDPVVTCTKTNRAYERLIEGSADIIFCAKPSDAQIEDAAKNGVEFELTPFGKEAFVFIVNADNPLTSITVSQIRDVYSGKITKWEELGVPDLGDIMAYQRPKNSGSQTALEDLMGDEKLMDAPSAVVMWDMGDIIEEIEYTNIPNALGYSFRFFCTEMMNSGVKLLAIDGIEPTIENIRKDTYPITSTLYMVTRKGEDNPNAKALIDWVVSPQGQKLVEKSGYVGLE